jgi:glutathione S-transferase
MTALDRTDLTLIIGNKNYSSWSLRPWLALKQSGHPFVEIHIPLDTPTSKQQILHYSPSGRVPALQHGSFLIWESLAICEYVAELFPTAQLWPADPQARAYARAVSAEMHAGFSQLRRHLPMDCRSSYPGKGIDGPGVQADIERMQAIWRQCRQHYGSGGDLLFGHFTIADAMFAPVVTRFTTYGVKLEAVATAYVEAIWALPTMQDWLTAARAESEVIEFP